ncbi:MAG: DUF1223 domain-containing protein [Pseudomonadota bacterium]|nr:DUF1223 domain-containing protein [Pseudomonadota bacterium]
MNGLRLIWARLVLGLGLALASVSLVSVSMAPTAGAQIWGPWPTFQINPLVVELFTSQGCYSCPPADMELEQLADMPGVLGLSFHVDYWDYIGWRDPFASESATHRQKYYRHVLAKRYIFTPQFVVGGNWSPDGRTSLLDQDLMAYKGDPIMLKTDQDWIYLPETRGLNGIADLWLVHFDHRHETDIRAGENAGRTLAYRHVVRDIKHLGDWRGENRRIAWPPRTGYGIALLVQHRGDGTILASIAHMQ